MCPGHIRNRMHFCLIVLASCALAAQAVPQYTVSNGSIHAMHVDPYFLDPGDDVIDFYSYGSPRASSANTGFEQLNTALIYLTLDDQGTYGLVTVLDKWGGGGGAAELSYTGFPAGSLAAVNDDPQDPHSYDPATGSGTNSWSWLTCCTDGAAWSLGQASSFQITLNYTFIEGLDTLRFLTFDPCNQNQLLYINLDASQPVVITTIDEGQPLPDCNGNGTADFCDLSEGTSQDCNGNQVPDECELDCNGNGNPDSCDIASGSSADCNLNGIPDECEAGPVDCNLNGNWDLCDIATGVSLDLDQNGVPDECQDTSGSEDRPAEFGLHGNHPNPFNPSTLISFGLDHTAPVRLAVYSLNGTLVQVLVDGMAERGRHTVEFDAGTLASGVYLYRLESEGRIECRRMLLVR